MRRPSLGVGDPGMEEKKLVRTMDIRRGKQLIVKARVWTSLGETRVLSILVDTGAQVNLVKQGSFGEEAFVPAKRPVDLVSVSGDKVEGGQKAVPLSVAFLAKDWSGGEE